MQTFTADKLLSTQQAADRLAVDKKTILRYLHSGKLKGARIGRDYRIPESSVNSLVAGSEPAPARTGLARITAVVNQKGGVGKTTTTFNLGVALQRLGRRVLLVDFDPQASLSVSAGIPIATLSMSVYQLLLDDKLDPKPVIVRTASGVDVLPATIDLAAAEIELVTMTLRELVLRDVLAKLRDSYDHILIDCPPSLGLLTVNALAAADQVIIPLECEFLATRGLALLMRSLQKIQGRLNRNLRLAGILATKFDGRTIHANEVLEEIRSNFPGQVYDVVIKHTVKVKEAPIAGQSILEYDRSHEVARAFNQLAMEVDRA